MSFIKASVAIVVSIVIGTPRFLRPLWWVVYLLMASLAVAAVRILVYRMFGEVRQIDIQFLLSMNACFVSAAVAFALARELIADASILRPWLLGFATSAGLWGSMALLRSTAMGSDRDLVALIVVTFVFGGIFGYVFWKYQQAVNDA